MTQDKALEDFSDDYAIQQVRQVEKMIRAFCTPLDDVTDEELVRKCCDRARWQWTARCSRPAVT